MKCIVSFRLWYEIITHVSQKECVYLSDNVINVELKCTDVAFHLAVWKATAVRSSYLFAVVIVSYFCQDLVEGLSTGCRCVRMPGKVNSGREPGNTLPALSSAPFVCLSTGGGTEPMSHRLRLRDSARSGHT